MSIDKSRASVPELEYETYAGNGFDLGRLLEKHHFGNSHDDPTVYLPKSIPSKTLFSVTLPDPENPSVEFVYNYFVPNERAPIPPAGFSTQLYNPSEWSPEDIEYVAATERLPRFNRLKFTPPDFSETINISDVSVEMGGTAMYGHADDFDDVIGVTSDNKISIDLASQYISDFNTELGSPLTKEVLGEIVSTLTVEGAASNPTFTGVEIIDTFADEKIYSFLSSSMVFQNVGVNANSPRERAQIFRDKITDDSGVTNVAGSDKNLLIDVLTQLQPAGISMAPGDVDEATAQVAADLISNQSFSVKFGNLFFGDIVQYASYAGNNVYEDEIRALVPVAEETQRKIIATIDPTVTYEHDYQMQVRPLKITALEFPQAMLDGIEAISSAALTALKVEMFGTTSPSDEDFEGWVAGLQPMSPYSVLLNAIAAGLTDPVGHLLSRLGLPKVKVIGYLIQKTEILADGTTQKFPDIFIDNPRHFTEYVDRNVRYGGVYNYKLRSVALVTAVTKVINKEKGDARYAIVSYLMLSDGKVTTANCVENIPPPPPARVNARVDYDYRKPVITWEFPLNLQRDIKRFQVFKRNTFNEPFTLMAEYDFDDSYDRTLPNEVAQKDKLFRFNRPYRRFTDHDFELNYDTAIYAIACVDAHGLSSNYSKQILVKYDKYTNRLSVKCVSVEGAPKPYPNFYIQKDFFEDLIRSSGRERCTIFFDPEYYKIKKYNRDKDKHIIGEEEVSYIKTSDTKYHYNFSFINVDLQVEKNLEVRVTDHSGLPTALPAADLSRSNLSFEFGLGDTTSTSGTEPSF